MTKRYKIFPHWSIKKTDARLFRKYWAKQKAEGRGLIDEARYRDSMMRYVHDYCLAKRFGCE